MIFKTRSGLWSLQMQFSKITWDMQTSLKASLAYCAKIPQGVVTTDQIVDMPLCDPPSAQKNMPSNAVSKERYRLRVDKSSQYQPMPPELASSTGSKPKVSQYTISAQNLLHTEELMRRAAICGSITDFLVASTLQYIPEEARGKVVQEQVRTMHKSSHKAMALGTAPMKMAGPSKGARQWRCAYGGSPSWFCPATAKPAGRVQIIKNPAVGCPVEVRMSSASFDKDAYSIL